MFKPEIRERLWRVLALGLLSIFIFQLKDPPGVGAKDKESGNLYDELKVFTDVLAIVQRDYVKPVENKKVIEGAIKGMLATLDPHSGYLEPTFYQDLQVQTRGEFGGLGIEITIKDGLLVVVTPMEGSPAERAGIRPGDSIVKIEGKYTKEFSLVDAVQKLRGPRGSKVHLSVFRKGVAGLLEFTLMRDNIQVKSVRKRYLGDNFGYVRLNQFMEKTGEDLENAIKDLKAQSKSDLKGLVLDLRNNPGGLLTQAIRVSDLFLREGVIVYTDGRIEAQKQKFFAHERGTEPDYPIVVLVNGGSASASEIVSGALKDHGRALIIGTQTFGKGSVQTITPLENGGALTLTTALYYTKSGRSIQLTGVKPDIEIENPIPESLKRKKANTPLERMREGDLPGAISNPSGLKDEKGKIIENNSDDDEENEEVSVILPESIDIEEWKTRDLQFSKAFELLKTFDIFKGAKPLES